MSDVSQGPGWWIASDGKWYPPEQAPGYAPPTPAPAYAPTPAPAAAPTPAGADTPLGPGWWQATDGRWYPPQPGYPPPAGYSPGPKKPIYKRVWFWLLVVFALGIGGCVTIVATAGIAINNANTKSHTVVYSVIGSGTATITYDAFDNSHNGSAQISDVPLPWTKTVTGSGLFNAYSVTATLGQNGGTATCSISVDGKRVSTNSATGAFASASCTGSAS